MAKDMTDIKRTASGDIDLSSGDIVFTDCTEHHQRDILLARKGDYRISPGTGVGIADYLDDENPAELLRAIKQQLTADGMTVTTLGVAGGKINIDAGY